MFNKNSMIVKAWVDVIKRGDKTTDDIPNLSNLIDVVTGIMEEVEINV